MTKGVIFCAIAWVALAACSKHNVTISGSIKHAGKEQVYLEQINVGYNVTVDSAQTDKDGKFTFKTYVELPTFFNVKVGESGPVTFIASADEDIQISGTLEGLEQNYWVDGSENSLWIKLLNFQLNNTLTAMDSLQETFKAIPEDHAAKRAEVAHAWDSVVNKQINFSKEFILKHAVSPASYYALYQKFNDNSFILDPIEDLHSYKIVASSLKAMYPESQYTKAILQHLDQISNSIQNERIRRIIDNADSNLPAISLPNVSGDTIALSDLRGKYIILDFNVLGAKESEGYIQELKKVYNKFRNRGVEIYQVCLDNNQLLWSRLVKQYGITWQCVRDPQGLQSRVAQTWNVQTVPANYIINPKFEIVGKNLTGARLEERLNDLETTVKSPNQKIPDRAHEVTLAEGKKAYFLSDLHLGAPVLKDNRARELQIVEWLERIRPDCGMLFLLGDIFDFWFEYKRAVPQGHVRFLAKISEFADQGIPVHFFTGNHDIWTFGYLTRECGVILHTRNEAFRINGKDFLIGHGDALNPQDRGYLWLYHIFHNHFLQRCFRWVHPDVGIWLAHKWSSHSRLGNGKIEADGFRGEGKEEIIGFCRRVLQHKHFDYFVFGHRHLPLDFALSPDSRYINTGDWISHYSFATFDGARLILEKINQ